MGIGNLKDNNNSVLSGKVRASLESPPVSKQSRQARQQQQVQVNPFVIQNMTLRDKFAIIDTDEARFLKSFERLENTIQEAEKMVNIDHSHASTIEITRKNHAHDSIQSIAPSHEQAGEVYRQLIAMTNIDASHGSSTKQNNLHSPKQAFQVPPINVNMLRPVWQREEETARLTAEALANQKPFESFQQSARENYWINQRQGGGKVEVINSASTAYRNFVNEKTLYLKGLDPLSTIRMQGNSQEGQQKLQLHAISQHKKPTSRGRHAQKPTSPANNHLTQSFQIKQKHKKGAHKGKSPRSPRKEQSPERRKHFEEKRQSLKKPILTSKKYEEQMKTMKANGLQGSSSRPSLEAPQQLSTATLLNDRNQTNASQFLGRPTMTTGKQNASQDRHVTVPKEQLVLQQQEASQHQLFQEDLTPKGSSKVGHKTAHDVLMSQKRGAPSDKTQELLESQDNVNSLHKMPSVSPTFKQLSDIFAFMDKHEFEEQQDNQGDFQAPPTVQVQMQMQMTERSREDPQHNGVRKRTKKQSRGGTKRPFETMANCRFGNSKLGVSPVGSESRAQRRNSNQTSPRWHAEQRKAASVKPISSDPNNLSNRFFSLRRQRERRHEAIVQIQKEHQATMNYRSDKGEINQPQPTRPVLADYVTGSVSPKVTTKKLPKILEGGVEEEGHGSQGSGSINAFSGSWPNNFDYREQNYEDQEQDTRLQQKVAFMYGSSRHVADQQSRGGDTQMAEASTIYNEPSQERVRGLGNELQNLLQQSLINNPSVQLSTIPLQLKDKYKSSMMIDSETASNGQVCGVVVSSTQSCLASDANDLGMLDARNFVPEDIVHKGSQSLIDADHDYLPIQSQVYCEGVTNSIHFDPKVKITGVNSDKISEDDQASMTETQHNLLLPRNDEHQPPANNPAELEGTEGTAVQFEAFAQNQHHHIPYHPFQSQEYRPPSEQQQHTTAQQQVQSQFWEFFMSQQQNNTLNGSNSPAEIPLILQQEAIKRKNDFARIGKDGRISLLGEKSTAMRNSSLTPGGQSELDRATPLEIQISQPWKTHQEQRDSEQAAMDLMIQEEKERRIQIKNKQVIHHHIENNDESSQGEVYGPRGANTQRDPVTIGRATTPYNTKYKPNARTALIRPLLEGSNQRRTVVSPQVTISEIEQEDREQDTTTQNYFKVKVPLLAINKANSQDKHYSHVTNRTERRQTVDLKFNTKDSNNIKQGSFRLKDQRTLPELERSLGIRINSAVQQITGNAISSEIGRQDTLQIFNGSTLPQTSPKLQAVQPILQQEQIRQYPTENLIIDTGEFTYSKLIIRDKNGIGKSPMIKELKYVPVCDMSMKKRKASKAAHDDWHRLNAAASEKLQAKVRSTISPPITPGIVGEIGIAASGSREMGCMINEDIFDEMTPLAGGQITPGPSWSPQRRDTSTTDKSRKQNKDKNFGLIKIQNQTLKQQQKIFLTMPQKSRGNTPRDLAIDGPNAQTVFRVPYPTKSQLGLAFETKNQFAEHIGSVNSIGAMLQQIQGSSHVVDMNKQIQEQALEHYDSRPISHLTQNNATPRQSEMREQPGELVPKYD